MKYYKFPMQVAVNGPRIGTVKNFEELVTFAHGFNFGVVDPDKRAHVYCSVYSHNVLDADVRYVADHNDCLVIDRAFMDLDNRHIEKLGKVETWLEQAQRIHKFEMGYDLMHYVQASSFSGGHFITFCKNQPLKYPHDAIWNFVTFLEQKCDILADPWVRDLNRVYRIPSTYHPGKHCWCTPLKQEELENTKLDVKVLTSKQRELIVDDYIMGSKLVDLTRFDRPRIANTLVPIDIGKVINTKEQATNVGAIDVTVFPPCVRAWCKTKELGYWGRYELINFMRHQRFYKLVPQQIIDFMHNVLSEKKFHHMMDEEENLPMKAIYRHDYKMSSCFRLVDEKLCPQRCGRWHPIYQ